MRKIYLLLVLTTTFCFSQVFNNETFDNTGWGAPYSNTYPITFSGDYTITNATTSVSGANSMPSNYPNASGGNYVRLQVIGPCPSCAAQFITINNINTNNASINKLKFGVYFGSSPSSYIPNLLIEQSIDNVNWSTVNYIAPPYNIWVLAITTTNLINSDNLTIRFKFYPNQLTSANYYNVLLDDINITSTLSNDDFNKPIVTVYPNPTKDNITINLTNQNGLIKLHNIVGQLIYSQQITQLETVIPIKQFGVNGLNLLSIYDDNNKLIRTEKIILQ